MKKLLCVLLAICLLIPSLALAKKKEAEPIPARYLPVLQDWNATTAEELRFNIIEHWTPRHNPCAIRFGGTTKELIADKKNWQLAIVSSKDVDLQERIDHKILDVGEYGPDYITSIYQWLLPENLSYILNKDPMGVSQVFVYDYDAENDDATLLICQPAPQRENAPLPVHFAVEIMWKRSAETARAVQGIRLIPDSAKWAEKDFLTQNEDWDVGILRLPTGQQPSLLDKAELLYDFSQIDSFASRASVPMPDYLVNLANGVLNTDNQMVGIPCVIMYADDPAFVGMLIVNAKSPNVERALIFALHYVKSLEWKWPFYEEGGAIPPISRDDVDW